MRTTNQISFMSANFVARELGYRMAAGWGHGDQSTNAALEPLETFPTRFAALLDESGSLGFQALDLWSAHLNWTWATERNIAIARGLLRDHALTQQAWLAILARQGLSSWQPVVWP